MFKFIIPKHDGDLVEAHPYILLCFGRQKRCTHSHFEEVCMYTPFALGVLALGFVECVHLNTLRRCACAHILVSRSKVRLCFGFERRCAHVQLEEVCMCAPS